MSLLPHVLSVDASKGEEVVIDLELLPELEAFAGHFPGNPILPGVVQIDWVVRFAEIYFGAQILNTRDFQVKFRNIILPNVPLSLSLKLNAVRGQFLFVYTSSGIIMASGQFKLKARA